MAPGKVAAPACGDADYLAEKQVRRGNTTSLLRHLTDAEHIAEVARLISGDTLTSSSLENAKALIAEAAEQDRPSRKKSKIEILAA